MEIEAGDVRTHVLARIRLERWAARTSKLLAREGGAPLEEVEAALAVGSSIAGAVESVAFKRGSSAADELRGVQDRSKTVLANIRNANERSPEQVRCVCPAVVA